jgi:hypothetical protein
MDIQPERGVVKILVDTHQQGPDKLTPLGLWHRFFQGWQNGSLLLATAEALPQSRRLRGGFPSAVTGTYVGSDLRALFKEHGVPTPAVEPATRFWRSGYNYMGSEADFDAQGMAMAFPKGITYGAAASTRTFSPNEYRRTYGKKVQRQRWPEEIRVPLRKILDSRAASDTEAIRSWFEEIAPYGPVYITTAQLGLGAPCAVSGPFYSAVQMLGLEEEWCEEDEAWKNPRQSDVGRGGRGLEEPPPV